MEVFDMGNELQEEQDIDSQVFLGDDQTKTIECPNCKVTVPYAIYCLKCGFPMYSIMNGDEDKKESINLVEDEPIESSEQELEESIPFSLVPVTQISYHEQGDEKKQFVTLETDGEGSYPGTHTHQPILETDLELDNDELMEDRKDEETPLSTGMDYEDDEIPELMSHEEGETDVGESVFDIATLEDEEPLTCRPDGATRDLVRELLNSANLMLWSIGQLLENSMSEDNFSRMFEGYDERWRRCTELRLEKLQRAKDTIQLNDGLERAKVNLGELELRLSIGDLLDGEYEAKAPAYRWEIDRFEGEIERRRAEIDFLEDLGNVAPKEELGRLEVDTTLYLEKLESDGKREHSEETFEKVKRSLEEILQYITSEV
jgi:hypothetical protein